MEKHMIPVRAALTFILALLLMAGISLVFTTADALAQVRPALVKDVENPAHSPFVGYASDTIDVNWLNTILSVGTVPIGKRLVIEHVGIRCTGDIDDSFPLTTVSIHKGTNMGWSSYSVPIQMSLQGTTYDGKASWTASEALRLYSDGVNAATAVNIFHKKTTAAASCSAIVSGYTVDMP